MKYASISPRQSWLPVIALDWLSRPTTRAILWCLLAAQFFAAAIFMHPWKTGDTGVYVALAEGLRSGGYGTFPNGQFQPDVLRPPGLPIILALWPLGTPALIALHGGIYMACVALAERIFRLPILPLAVIYPFPAFYLAAIGTEAWAMLAATLTVWLMMKRTPRAYALAGVVAGLGAMFRSDLLLLPVALAAAILVRNWRQAWIPLAAAALAVTPYSLWNLHHFGSLSPTPLAGALGNSLWSASWQPHVGRDDLNAFYEQRSTPAAEAAGLADQVRGMNAQLHAPPLSSPSNPTAYADQRAQIASEDLARAFAIRNIAADPGAYAGHVARNVFALWNTSHYPAMPAPLRVLLQIISALVWALALAGVALALRRPRLWPALAVLLYVPAIHLWLHTEARYTAAVRPLLLGFAVLAIIALIKRLSPGWRPAPGSSP